MKQVNQYTYLGVTISKTGLQSSSHDLALKAQKAWFGLKNILYSNNIRHVKLILHLFDACIKPILLYGSEVWSSKFSKSNLFNLKLKTENIHLKCCKWILGISKTCSNLGTLGELGRLPMSYFVHLNAIKYWAHISTLPMNRLVRQVYEHAKKCNSSWYSFVKESLKNIKIDINMVKIEDDKSKRNFIKKLEPLLKTRFSDQWEIKIKASSNPKHLPKLRTYITFKKDFKMESYLEKESNFERRRLFSKLRLSDHDLEIEAGRRRNIPSSQRFCNHCKDSNKIEDEFHFIVECNKYSEKRKSLYEEITTSQNTFSNFTDREKFNYIMSYKTNLASILIFIGTCLRLR